MGRFTVTTGVQMTQVIDSIRGNWHRARLHGEVFVWRQGWIWPLAVVGLVGAALFALWTRLDTAAVEVALRSRQQQVDRVVSRLEDERRRAQYTGDAAVSADQPMLSRQERLHAVLRNADEATVQLRQLYQLAEGLQLAVRQTDFQQTAGTGGIGRLQISMPIKGTYTQLRGFVEQALRELPNLSVDRLQFKRNQVGQAQLEATVHLSLWQRERPTRPTGLDAEVLR